MTEAMKPRSALAGTLFPQAAGQSSPADPKKVSSRSHYYETLSPGGSPLHGNSRNWGDAAPAVQAQAACEIVRQARERGWNDERIAFALAVARNESGFNPDAASRSTSASGLGQFIDSTGSAYGLDEQNRFETPTNANALLSYLEDCLRFGRRAGEADNSEARAYGLYHDGPSLAYGGELLARTQVLPWIGSFRRWLAGAAC
jgi:putative chitinase